MSETEDSYLLGFFLGILLTNFELHMYVFRKRKKNPNSPWFLCSTLQKKNEGVDHFWTGSSFLSVPLNTVLHNAVVLIRNLLSATAWRFLPFKLLKWKVQQTWYNQHPPFGQFGAYWMHTTFNSQHRKMVNFLKNSLLYRVFTDHNCYMKQRLF